MMLQNIFTHVIAGPLGAGKTSLIQHLMTQKPADERWAVLVNEFGQIGLDAALMGAGSDAIAIAEVAGGCVCCQRCAVSNRFEPSLAQGPALIACLRAVEAGTSRANFKTAQ